MNINNFNNETPPRGKLVPLKRNCTPIEAICFCAILDSEGIEYVLHGERLISIGEIGSGQEILVLEEQLELALEVLEKSKEQNNKDEDELSTAFDSEKEFSSFQDDPLMSEMVKLRDLELGPRIEALKTHLQSWLTNGKDNLAIATYLAAANISEDDARQLVIDVTLQNKSD